MLCSEVQGDRLKEAQARSSLPGVREGGHHRVGALGHHRRARKGDQRGPMMLHPPTPRHCCQAINKSLACLGDVIFALGSSAKGHIPFRKYPNPNPNPFPPGSMPPDPAHTHACTALGAARAACHATPEHMPPQSTCHATPEHMPYTAHSTCHLHPTAHAMLGAQRCRTNIVRAKHQA